MCPPPSGGLSPFLWLRSWDKFQVIPSGSGTPCGVFLEVTASCSWLQVSEPASTRPDSKDSTSAHRSRPCLDIVESILWLRIGNAESQVMGQSHSVSGRKGLEHNALAFLVSLSHWSGFLTSHCSLIGQSL